MRPSVIAVFTLLSCVCGENPGVKVVLTNKWLQYVKHVGAGWVQDKLEKITFPDISGDVNIHIGTVYYTLSGTTVTKCDLPEPVVEFSQDNTGVKTSIEGLSVALAGDWRTNFGLIHDGGTFEMAIFSMSLTSVVQLGKDSDGHLSVSSLSCDAQVGDVDIQFHGGASWIFQPFVDHFKGHIVDMIQSQICPKVQEFIVSVESDLQAMSVSVNVSEVLSFEIPLTDPPVIEASNLKMGLKGEFYSIKTHMEPPFVAQPFTMPEQPDHMLSVGMSEFTMNSASYGYFSAGQLQALINDSMIPPASPVRLNTSSMGVFIPQLPKQFPNLLMVLQVYASDSPMVSLQPGLGELGLQVGVIAYAIEPNTTQVPLFKLSSISKFSGKMWIADQKLKGSVTMDNFTLTLVSSEVGTFKTDALENGVKMGIKMMVLPKLNTLLGNGIPLPQMKQGHLVNSVLNIEKGFLDIYSDVEIEPAERNNNFL
ncbi:bactericidal permeability-increasing protein [Austrofundulus limnaeus]|uniref:Bactericidal permeability-increasing protein n=1 Tax=Austrofundulus limnaeus TaxID=52670 RepID=A0A2I4ANS7_AUSLI|nr:PREDICTED: bactericidal permeability-increasing protein-like [Austrofundulus limnaeus]